MTRRRKIINNKINKGLNDIVEAELFIESYEATKELITDPKEIAKMDIKIDQLKESIKTNQKFVDFFKSL